MKKRNVNISIVGDSTSSYRNFMFQFSKLLAKSIAIVDNLQKNAVVLQLCKTFIPSSMKADDDLPYFQCDDFILIDRILSDEILMKMGIKRDLDFIVCDYINEDADIIFYVVEQSLDSAAQINDIYDKFNEFREDRLGEAEQRVIFLNFLDHKFSPEYFLEFHLHFEDAQILKYYIDFDEKDMELGFLSDMDGDFNLIKLSNHRIFEIISMFKEIIQIENPKNHVKQLRQNEKMSRRRRKC